MVTLSLGRSTQTKRVKTLRGESLTETLVALAVASLAVAVMASMLSAAAKMTMEVRGAEKGYHAGESVDGCVTVRDDATGREVRIEVESFGDENGYIPRKGG